MKQVKLLVMDVDGTMTDGKIYMGAGGELLKAFDIKDGYGIHEILPAHHIKSAIITGRTSPIVAQRAKELEIDFVYQGKHEKLPHLLRLAEGQGYDMKEIAYMGDDILDIACLEASGYAGCPVDAVERVKEICDFISTRPAGSGAVREFIEWLVAHE